MSLKRAAKNLDYNNNLFLAMLLRLNSSGQTFCIKKGHGLFVKKTQQNEFCPLASTHRDVFEACRQIDINFSVFLSIPVQDVTAEECVEISKIFGQR